MLRGNTNGRNHDQGNQKLGLPSLRGHEGVVQRGMPQLPTERWIMYGLPPSAEDQAAAFAQRMHQTPQSPPGP